MGGEMIHNSCLFIPFRHREVSFTHVILFQPHLIYSRQRISRILSEI